MAAYYNEIDPYAAQWLRNLIAAGQIAPGDVDERSIVDVRADDLRGYEQCHFFAGIGGWSVALRLAGWDDNCAVWTGSCPCQPLSVAGQRKGHADERHLWPAFYTLISQCEPSIIFGEQVASKDGREWLAAVRADLEEAGYACGAADMPAGGFGAPHKRHRLWWVGSNPHSDRWQRRKPIGTHCQEGFRYEEFARLVQDEIQLSLPTGKFAALSDGVSNRMALARAFGNAIVPRAAAAFIEATM